MREIERHGIEQEVPMGCVRLSPERLNLGVIGIRKQSTFGNDNFLLLMMMKTSKYLRTKTVKDM